MSLVIDTWPKVCPIARWYHWQGRNYCTHTSTALGFHQVTVTREFLPHVPAELQTYRPKCGWSNWQLTKNRIGELFLQGRHILHSCIQHHEAQKPHFPRSHFFCTLFLLEKISLRTKSVNETPQPGSVRSPVVRNKPARPVARSALISEPPWTVCVLNSASEVLTSHWLLASGGEWKVNV